MQVPPDKFPARKKLPHGAASWVRGEVIFFVTIGCSPRGLNQLCSEAVSAAIWESVEFRQQRGDWGVHLWLLMPDHLHALISFPKDHNLSKTMSNWKEIIAKKTGVHWQRDFFDHRLRSAQELQDKANYICRNPVRKGLVSRAEDWKFIWRPDGGPSGPALP
jgi:REP element-mobilizing transposase RayT